MPTGYTADVADGKITDLRSFAMLCARGMGALIMMRDEPFGAPIPERFEPSDYHAKKMAEAVAERDRLYAMDDAEAEQAASAEYAEQVEAKERWLSNKRDQRQRYQAMINLVEPWQRAPEGLKEFMLDQLRCGMEFDCPADDSYWLDPELLSGAEWKARKLETLQKSIMRDAAGQAEEVARTEGRNAWVAQLRAALEQVPA